MTSLKGGKIAISTKTETVMMNFYQQVIVISLQGTIS